MSNREDEPGNLRTFWDWFLLGALFGLVYNLIRNPGGCACCAGCLVLLLLVAVAVVIAVILDNLLVVLLIAGLVAAWYFWRKSRDQG